ncbi:hypothetical protein MASR1M50_26910 [Burkholderiales bacterium]
MAQHDLDIARRATPRAIAELAREQLGVDTSALRPHGHHVAKLTLAGLGALAGRPDGRLILVSATSPTPAGEGKTTTAIGLADGLRRLGQRAVLALRQPSMGPVFGLKGGATGGGQAQLLPMEDINLHFTGDFHAVAQAHNLLAALIDNHLQHGNALDIDVRRIHWRRVLDMNDRALRHVVTGLGGAAHGLPRESGFDITAASEVMAILCLAGSLPELKARLGRIVVADTRDGRPVTAAELKAHGAMAVLLKDALAPNLVQTLEHTPGAAAWRAVRQHRARLQLGHGHARGAQAGRLGHHRSRLRRRPGGREVRRHQVPRRRPAAKCRRAGHHRARAQDAGRRAARGAGARGPARAATRHGQPGAPPAHPARGAGPAQRGGAQPLRGRHRGRAGAAAPAACRRWARRYAVSRHWAEGGAGALALARAVVELCDGRAPAAPRCVYDAGRQPVGQAAGHRHACLRRRRRHAPAPRRASASSSLQAGGWGHLAVCVAKTPYSFSSRPRRCWAPRWTTRCTCAKCACRPVPASSSWCAATSWPCPACRRARPPR